MDQQIDNPDPGLNYNVVISTGDPHLEMEKNIYMAGVQIIATLQIVMQDDTVLSVTLKNLLLSFANREIKHDITSNSKQQN